MIYSFCDATTEQIFQGRSPDYLDPVMARLAWRRLAMLHAAVDLQDLAVLEPRTHAPAGEKGTLIEITVDNQHCIRFYWHKGQAEEVCFCETSP